MDDLQQRLQAALPSRYTLERVLGRGGMATVFLARESRPQRQVAIKVLASEVAARLGRERFLREVDFASTLTHPHIVPVYAAGEAGGLLYYVMPYVEGESLRDRLAREPSGLPVGEALAIAHDVADALQVAHEHNIVHRDIKPENIFLHRGHALVADFGIARAMEAAGRSDTSRTNVTEVGTTLGTPAYMSPEQASAETSIDGRSDVYSLGCVLYEMLVGEPPFCGQSMGAVLVRHLTDPVPSIRASRPVVPPSVEEVVRRALEKDPAKRFASARALSVALWWGGHRRAVAVTVAVSSGKVRHGVRQDVVADARKPVKCRHFAVIAYPLSPEWGSGGRGLTPPLRLHPARVR